MGSACLLNGFTLGICHTLLHGCDTAAQTQELHDVMQVCVASRSEQCQCSPQNHGVTFAGWSPFPPLCAVSFHVDFSFFVFFLFPDLDSLVFPSYATCWTHSLHMSQCSVVHHCIGIESTVA